MFLSSIDAYIVIPVIAVVVAQYAFALFCLMKLAYLDISRKNYVLWNLFILIVFFIGGAVFLVYYYKHPELLIQKTPQVTDAEPEASAADDAAATDNATEPQSDISADDRPKAEDETATAESNDSDAETKPQDD